MNKWLYYILFLHFAMLPSLVGASSTSFDYKTQNAAFWNQHLHGETLKICRQRGTEKPGSGKYDKWTQKGTYYCACCGGDYPVFSSIDKYDSGTGWPSFTKPLPGAVLERPDPDDRILGMLGLAKTEVLCARCESHLGHVFDDGPKPTGKRYCMNSTSLVFVAEGQAPQRTYKVD